MAERESPTSHFHAERNRLGEVVNNNFPDISYLRTFEPPPWVFENSDDLHDDRHAAATQIAGNLWLKTEDFDDLAVYRDLINHALVLHDSGRRRVQQNGSNHDDTDKDHGIKGAEIAGELLRDRLPASSLHIVMELIKGHAPGGQFDSNLDPRLLKLIKLADKSQLQRIERIKPGTIDRSNLSSPLVEEIFFPLHDALYAEVDVLRENFWVNGYKAILLSGVGHGVVNPR